MFTIKHFIWGFIFPAASLVVLNTYPLPARASFMDVTETHFNAEAIGALQSDKVIQGYDDGTYKPQNRINRAEFVKILIASQFDEKTAQNCIDSKTNETNDWDYHSFDDVPPGQWFSPYICLAKEKGIVSGYPDGLFHPDLFINFAEASKVVTKGIGISLTPASDQNWFSPFVRTLEERKAIPSTVQFFDKHLTRGEMAEIVWRLKADRRDKVSATYEEITSPLPTIASCDALKEKISAPSTSPNIYLMRDSVGAPLAPMAAQEKSTSNAASDYSQTNVQVAGVDEADVIKNDGEFIYLLKDSTVRIVKAYPANAMKEMSTIDFTTLDFRPGDLFVHGKTLVVIGRVNRAYPYPGPMTKMAPSVMPIQPYYQGSESRVYLYDLSDKSQPKEVRQVTIDGDYSTSRRIDDQLYLVLNAYPHYWILEKGTPGEKLVPQMHEGEQAPQPIANCDQIRYFPGYAYPNYLITASIPLNDPEGIIEREVFLGSSENVYASLNHLYVASSQVPYAAYTDWDWKTDHTNTLVFKFALDQGKITFKGRGSVPGRILNQFSMDENDDYFRIATTIDSWNPDRPSSNNVYVLDSALKSVGQIEQIAPGEKIYSTRFMGDRLYMVTFKQIDPFFVIDLKDPKNPTILGKLKIPGVSHYLHPYDENHVLGFGQNTEESKEGTFAWFQGMKVALYDVSDVSSPKELFVASIGDRGTYSELFNNHKALLFDKTKGLLAFPVQVYEIDPKLKAETQEPANLYGQPTFQGAYVYHLDPDSGFTLKGRVTHYTKEDELKSGYGYYDVLKNIQRILYIGENLYTISPGTVKASTMDTVKEVKRLEIK